MQVPISVLILAPVLGSIGTSRIFLQKMAGCVFVPTKYAQKLFSLEKRKKLAPFGGRNCSELAIFYHGKFDKSNRFFFFQVPIFLKKIS